jgi:hypothetical protein
MKKLGRVKIDQIPCIPKHLAFFSQSKIFHTGFTFAEYLERYKPLLLVTRFRISNVKKALISQPATYFLSAKLIGNDQERYVGEAYFRSY